PLEREIAAHSHRFDDPQKGLPTGFSNPWKYVAHGEVQRQSLWDALRKYAGPRSWVSFNGDIPRLQPEIIQPMRWLLRKSSIFRELHSSAVQYFQTLARQRPTEWARWTSEALYHCFQRDGVKAASFWTKILKHKNACDHEARRYICELLVSGDFVDD